MKTIACIYQQVGSVKHVWIGCSICGKWRKKPKERAVAQLVRFWDRPQEGWSIYQLAHRAKMYLNQPITLQSAPAGENTAWPNKNKDTLCSGNLGVFKVYIFFFFAKVVFECESEYFQSVNCQIYNKSRVFNWSLLFLWSFLNVFCISILANEN